MFYRLIEDMCVMGSDGFMTCSWKKGTIIRKVGLRKSSYELPSFEFPDLVVRQCDFKYLESCNSRDILGTEIDLDTPIKIETTYRELARAYLILGSYQFAKEVKEKHNIFYIARSILDPDTSSYWKMKYTTHYSNIREYRKIKNKWESILFPSVKENKNKEIEEIKSQIQYLEQRLDDLTK